MGRNSISEAIVLQSRRFAEYHKRLTLLTDNAGIVDAVAYGAFKSKSKMAGITDSFTRIRAYLYVDPVKQQYKLSDGELIGSNDGIRGELRRFYIASIISELVQVTYAGGDEFRKLFPLVESGFAALSEASDHVADLLLVQMLMRFFVSIGYPPHWSVCERCGSDIDRGSTRFVSSAGSIFCSRCTSGDATAIPPGGFAYLEHTFRLEFNESLRVDLEAVTLKGLKRGFLRYAQAVSETPLRSLKGAEAIIF